MAHPSHQDKPVKGPRRHTARSDRGPPDPQAPPQAPGHPLPPAEDAAWDYRESPEDVAAHQTQDIPPTPRGRRVPLESRLGRPRPRPPGLVLVALLLGLNALAAVAGLVALALDGGAESEAAGGPLPWAVVYLAAIAVVNLTLLYGLWGLRAWGYWGTLLLAALATAGSLVSVLAALATPGMAANVIGAVLGLAVIGYLVRPRVRALFG
jgi:uncharacterized membrane protein (DUF2068 family)